MKIVKRDGRTVDYDADKIRIAIGKANNEVAAGEKIGEEQIEEIIKYIELLDKKRMLVEDIQDIIEVKLMEYGKYALAKKYIIYRYKRSIIRQSNTTDASILSIMKNGGVGENNYLTADKQRDLMASEASKDLAYRLLLPNNVVEDEKAGRIKFLNVEHFTEPIIESVKIDLKSMFEEGTVINGIRIETPKSFQSAANVLVEIVGALRTCQTGDIYIDLADIFRYYDLSYEKKYAMYEALFKSSLSREQIRAIAETQSFLEVKTGIQTIFYQLNTFSFGASESSKVHFLIDLNTIESEHDEKVVFEFVKQKVQGIVDEFGECRITSLPSIILSVDYVSEQAKRYDYILNEIESSEIEYMAMSPERFEDFKLQLKKFNQGSMLINLGKIALDAEDKADFYSLLEKSLSNCYEGFLCRNHNLQGVYGEKSPIHWRHGAICRLATNEKIDLLLKKDKSNMRLICVGFEAACKILDLSQEEKRQVRDMIEDTIKQWNKENTFEVVVSNYCDDAEMKNLYSSLHRELRKYDIDHYEDSFEFMKDNYFRSGLLYYMTEDKVENLDSEVLSSGFIVVKK
ncbi:MAG TPA: hypothetical protein DCY94_03315 [Firmicutes bacterium]|nr:hypothetical protein [Bacillota bacterium]